MSMTGRTIRGVYRGGRVELAERPEGVGEEEPVLVTFLGAVAPGGASGSGSQDPERLRREAFALMERGVDLGGPPYPSREEIYDERIRELDERRRPRDG